MSEWIFMFTDFHGFPGSQPIPDFPIHPHAERKAFKCELILTNLFAELLLLLSAHTLSSVIAAPVEWCFRRTPEGFHFVFCFHSSTRCYFFIHSRCLLPLLWISEIIRLMYGLSLHIYVNCSLLAREESTTTAATASQPTTTTTTLVRFSIQKHAGHFHFLITYTNSLLGWCVWMKQSESDFGSFWFLSNSQFSIHS